MNKRPKSKSPSSIFRKISQKGRLDTNPFWEHPPSAIEQIQSSWTQSINNYLEETKSLLKEIDASQDEKIFPSDGVIYHYTDLNGLKGIIKNGELWATRVDCMNDPTEFSHGLSLYNQAIKETLAESEFAGYHSLLNEVGENINELTPSDIYAVCFSWDGDKLSQWRAYADNGCGVALGIDTARLTGLSPSPMWLNALYTETAKRALSTKLTRRGVEYYTNLSKRIYLMPKRSELLAFAIKITLPAFKHAGYWEENETRLFLIEKYDHNTKQAIRIRQRNGKDIPYVPLKMPNLQLPIKQIVLGPCLDREETEATVRNLLKEAGYDCNDILISKSEIPYRQD